MQNLAGHKDPDPIIRRELTRCGIEVVEAPERSPDEVSARITGKLGGFTRITGKLGGFTFRRAWCYWVVTGEMPLEVAKRIYAHPVGRTDVRVDGHCGCPPPEHPWLQYRDADGRKLIHDPDGRQERECREMLKQHPTIDELRKVLEEDRFVPDAAAVAARIFVDAYHVDSELGLYLIAEAIRGLVKPPGSTG